MAANARLFHELLKLSHAMMKIIRFTLPFIPFLEIFTSIKKLRKR